MVEVAIPVWHSKPTLSKALDSLVAQTKNMFITCLSIDGDGENYDEIVKEYTRRGLHIRTIYSPENGGPGPARQRAIETTQCDYIMFLDADDMLLPRTVELLYKEAKKSDADILRSEFIQEDSNEILGLKGSITWNHGKIYKIKYLRDNDIGFLPELRTDEDAYFNLVAWNASKNRYQINERTYLWRENKNSITRVEGYTGFFKKDYINYMYSQYKGLKKIYEITGEFNSSLVSQTIVNVYRYYMMAKFYELPLEPADEVLKKYRDEQWFQEYLNDGNNWIEIVNLLHAGMLVDKENLIFFKENFDEWIKRLCKA